MSKFILRGIQERQRQGLRLRASGRLFLFMALLALSNLFVGAAVAFNVGGPELNYCYDADNANGTSDGFISGAPGAGCTANDILLAIGNVNQLDGCIDDADTATFSFDASLTTNSNERYDVGLWFNTSGGDAVTDPSPLGTECSVGYLAPGDATPELNLETPAKQDACMDTADSDVVTGNIGFLTFDCSAISGNNLTFDYLITWHNSEGGLDQICQSTNQYTDVNYPTPPPYPTIDELQNAHNLGIALVNQTFSKCTHDETTTPVSPVPELDMAKTCNEDPGNRGATDDMILWPGDKLNCELFVLNSTIHPDGSPSGKAERVYVYDNFDPIFTLVDNFADGTSNIPNPPTVYGPDYAANPGSLDSFAYDGNTFKKENSFIWNIGDIDPGEFIQMKFDMTVDAGAVDRGEFVCNTAALALDNPGPAPDPADPTGTGTVTGPDGRINLWVDNPLPYTVGDNDPVNAPPLGEIGVPPFNIYRGVVGELQPETLTEVPGCTITLASVEDFRVSNAGGVNAIRWRTSSELGTLGFHVERLDPATGEYVRLNSELLPANFTASQGSDYELVDDSATAGKGTYRLIEVESIGRTLVHGPYETGKQDFKSDTNPPASSMGLKEEADVTAEGGKYRARGHQRSEKMQQRLDKVKQQHQQNGKQKPGRPDNKGRKSSSLVQPDESFSVAKLLRKGVETVLDFLIPSAHAASAMKVETDASRMYVITAQQIADTLGVTLASVEQRISTGDIKISSHGSEIGWHQQNGGIVFFADELSAEESLYANNNVSWVTLESGTVAGQVNGKANKSSSFSFREAVDAENNLFPAIHYPQLDSDFWYWGYLTSTTGSDDLELPLPLTFLTPGATGTGETVLTVRLKGAGIEADNRVEVAVNGTQVQTAQWSGKDEQIVTATFDGSLLQDENTLSLTPANGAAFTYVLFDGLTLEYDRLYTLENGYLRFSAESNTAVTLSGFTGEAISVFDISNPAATVELTGLAPKYSRKSKSWSVKIKTLPGAEYIAYMDTADAPVTVSTYDSQGVVASVQNADYIVIASEQTLIGARAMAAYRDSTGHQTAVVTFEQIVDELNDGIPTPWVVRDFLQQAWTASGGKTKYALIAGAGNFDYRFDYRDLKPDTAGTNLIPPPLVENYSGFFGVDMLFGDVDGDDGIPEIAVGRIPAFTDAELLAYRDKLQASEANHDGWAKRALWIADDAEAFGRFDDESDLAITKVSRDVEPVKAYLNKPYTKTEVNELITREIKKSALLVNYIGHGSESRLADESIYQIADVDDLDNTQLPVFIGLTCAIARFDIPGADSLGMALVMKEGGGASTVWGPTSLSSNSWASGAGREFLYAVFSQGENTVGAAVLAALRAQGADSDLISTHKFLQILGDPAALIR